MAMVHDWEPNSSGYQRDFHLTTGENGQMPFSRKNFSVLSPFSN